MFGRSRVPHFDLPVQLPIQTGCHYLTGETQQSYINAGMPLMWQHWADAQGSCWYLCDRSEGRISGAFCTLVTRLTVTCLGKQGERRLFKLKDRWLVSVENYILKSNNWGLFFAESKFRTGNWEREENVRPRWGKKSPTMLLSERFRNRWTI
jgi:hypothetical protein